MQNTTSKLDQGRMQKITDTLLAARKNNLKEVLEIAHRLENVCEKNGVLYINDSKSTNIHATFYSLECMTRPVVWVLSASDFEQDYDLLSDLVNEKVTAVICLVSNEQKLSFDPAMFGKKVRVVSKLADAVTKASELANSGDAVLFSPAHPSELCYAGYKERGEHFRKLASNL